MSEPDSRPEPSFESSFQWSAAAPSAAPGNGAAARSGTFASTWNQGRGAFGGLITAAAVRTIRDIADVDGAAASAEQDVASPRSLRTMTVRFMAPVVADQSATVHATRDHQSKRIGHYSARLEQAGDCCATVNATFAAGRESQLAVAAAARPVGTSEVESLADMPYIPGVTPEFTQFFRVRWTSAPPFTGAKAPVTTGWCRHRSEATSGIEAVVALLDAWPAPVLPMMKRPAPASSVTWSAQFLKLPEKTPEGWFYYRSEALDCADGYARMRAQLWYPDGTLCASTEQLVAVFY